MSKLTPMMQQYQEIKNQHNEEFLFFRLGDFYEMFFDDAIKASEILEITLTARDGGGGSKVPMCGVPFHSATGYVNKLVQKGYKVAICEQMEDPSLAKGLVKRDVIRIITPGTLLDENALVEKHNNYLVAVVKKESFLGLAYCDISTGFFAMTSMSSLTGLNSFYDELGRLTPAECLLTEDFHDHELLRRLSGALISKRDHQEVLDYLEKVTALNEGNKDGILSVSYDAALLAAALLYAYLEETQKQGISNVTKIDYYFIEEYMILDQQTRRNLEITHSLRNREKSTSLLNAVDYTVTAMGGRRLRSWLEQPLINREEIIKRQDKVETLVENIFLREDLRKSLRKVYDLERILTKIAYQSANGRDMIAMKNSLAAAEEVKGLLVREENNLTELGLSLEILVELRDELADALIEEQPVGIKEGNLIKSGYSKEVDELRSISKEGRKWIAELETREKEATGIKTMKVGYNRVFGYYLEVSKGQIDRVPASYIRKQTLANAERYITPELKELEDKVLNASEKLHKLEYEIFLSLRDKVAEKTVQIQQLAYSLSELDAYLSFAEAAVRNSYVRPELTEGKEIYIKDGRHPVVDLLLKDEEFIPNDCWLEAGKEMLAIITGPNMAGKSTYIRTSAVLAILAQAGSFVPSKEMRLGIVDRVFARVGAADDLATGQSTFMVEMNEVSNILKNATDRSLVILDEVGRGTSTVDGLSIAWAISEYIISVLKCRTLFATHYHELVALENLYQGVLNLSMAVKEHEDKIIFLRKVIKGGADKSYGIHVAEMAGLPMSVIKRAKEKLEELESFDDSPQLSFVTKESQVQISLEHPLVEMVRELDPDDLSPKEALHYLYELKKKAQDYS